jgi:hypothetical protein
VTVHRDAGGLEVILARNGQLGFHFLRISAFTCDQSSWVWWGGGAKCPSADANLCCVRRTRTCVQASSGVFRDTS